jgi:hypothetical protein
MPRQNLYTVLCTVLGCVLLLGASARQRKGAVL